jgi:hypothetical protein
MLHGFRARSIFEADGDTVLALIEIDEGHAAHLEENISTLRPGLEL